jgi:EAL domain-containing protein (putative c-di-GMP-specific phosphodiesterase class I)
MDKMLVQKVSQALQKYGIPAHSLEIEITESTLIENLQYTVNTLNELRELGVSLSLDDFGTGYSSLNYLKQFPINSLKIDRSFIIDITNDSRDAKMVESIISLAHNLSLKVIAEGVENIDQLKMLKSFKIEEIQGYLISKPLKADKATEIITTRIGDSLLS